MGDIWIKEDPFPAQELSYSARDGTQLNQIIKEASDSKRR